MENDQMTIDVSRLDGPATVRLRWLVGATAATARDQCGEAEEAFLLALAGLMDSYARRLGVPELTEPEPAAARTSSAADDLTAADALTLGKFVVRSAEGFRAEGREGIAGFLTTAAGAVAATLRERLAPGSDSMTVQ